MYTLLVFSFVTSFLLVYSVMPVVIRIAINKELVALPEKRSSHDKITPCLGGIPIYLGILFCSLLFTPLTEYRGLQYILAALVVVYMIGTKDDIEDLSAGKKVVALMVAIAILVTRGEILLESLYGLFGYAGGMPPWLAFTISAFTLLVISNSYNLIDGIDGLAGTIGVIATSFFGVWFFVTGRIDMGVVSMATAGGLLAFLRYNLSKSDIKTFMGDTGSLVIGILLGCMTIEFIDMNFTAEFPARFRFENPIAIVVGLLILPLFDTIRVFSTRIMRGVNPMTADRRHIHHMLIDTDITHFQATCILAFFNLTIFSCVLALDAYLGLHQLLGLIIGVTLLFTYYLHRRVIAHKQRQQRALP